MGDKEFVALLARLYADRPNDETISIGHWSQADGDPLPRFYADIGVTVAEIKQMSK
jgi:hypothetical protein